MSFVIWLIVLVVLVAIVGGIVMGIFNNLVTYRNRYKNAFAQIEVQLKRRYDLIPNLVETAKGYMKHERGTLEAVIQARNQAAGGLQKAAQDPGDPNAIKNLAAAEGAVAGDTRPALRARRGVSRPEGQPEHDAAQRRADLHREPRRVRAAGLQRRRDAVQHLQAADARRSCSPACSATARTPRCSSSRASRSRKRPRYRSRRGRTDARLWTSSNARTPRGVTRRDSSCSSRWP